MSLELNSIYHGDCLEVMRDIPDASIDMVLCDLPYGTTRCKWDSVLDLNLLWDHYKRIRKPNTPILLFAQQPFNIILGASNINELRYEWIWEKTNATGHLNAKRMPMKAHENILVFYDKLPYYSPIKTTGHTRKVSTISHKRNTKKGEVYGLYDHTGYDSTERYPRSVLKFPSDKQKSKLHPTQKPVALCEYFIKTYCRPDAVILDNCSGSGTTGEAARNLGMNYILIEKELNLYIDSVERLKIKKAA